jgi:hypothetical protein
MAGLKGGCNPAFGRGPPGRRGRRDGWRDGRAEACEITGLVNERAALFSWAALFALFELLFRYADWLAVQLVMGPGNNQDQTNNKDDESEVHLQRAWSRLIGPIPVNL